jgi:hypothetical protein
MCLRGTISVSNCNKVHRQLLFLVAVALLGASCAPQESESGQQAAEPLAEQEMVKPPQTVPYTVVEKWSIPNLGLGQVIAIDPAHRTEKGLRALAEELKYNTRQDRVAYVWIYDNPRGAALHQAAQRGSLTPEQERLQERHLIGMYSRNAVSGYHGLAMYLPGGDGDPVEVEY